MKTINFLFVGLLFFIFSFSLGYSQSDNCSAATVLNVGTTCNPTNGTTTGATHSIPGCTGNSDDDVWYQFVATSTTHNIVVNASSGMDAVVQLFRGQCSTLISLVCRDNAPIGGQEVITYSNFIPGQTYRIRVYHYGIGSGSGDFDICVTEATPPPTNDNCSFATPLIVNNTCAPTQGTTLGATPSSFPGCAGDADDDVWFSFVATNSVQTVTASTSDLLDLVLTIYRGPCSSLSTIACVDNAFTGGTESIQLVGLTVGETYYIRVYDYYTGSYGDFDICVTGTPTPAPINDEPCDAIHLPDVTSECLYRQFTTIGATKTTDVPAAYSCSGAHSDFSGGSNNPNPNWTNDVWFSIVVPPSGNITITHDPNITGIAGEITDGVMALYEGTCNNLTQIECSENYTYPGTGIYSDQPMLNVNNLTPGDTVYLRYWGYGTQVGDFGFCVTTATNDECENALYICDINGYSASTSPAYTPDRPGNMRGNAEEEGSYTWTPGTDQGGVFGSDAPGHPGSGQDYSDTDLPDVAIDNNSWIKFTASQTTATLNVTISDCFKNKGIQMQVFKSNGCEDFVPTSDYQESATSFVLTAYDLVVGDDYLLMVDGFAGDICNYTISANTGVLFPEIPEPAPICIGGSVTLTAPSGATSYEWLHNGSTSQSVSVSPGTTQTYQCVVTGLCDQKQTLEVEVEVKPSPIIEFNVNSPEICEGDNITIQASGATNYTWSNGATSASTTVSPTSTTTYTVTGEVSGCTSSKNITVEVTPTPNVSVSATNSTICEGETTTLTASGATSYLWNNGSTSNSITVSPTSTTSYQVTGTTDGCSAQDSQTITVKPLPTVAISNSGSNTICNGESITLTASGATTYEWNNGATAPSITVSPTTSGTYSVVGTTNGCNNNTSLAITVNQLPVTSGTAVASPSDCDASTGSISGLNISPSNASIQWTNSSGQVVSNTANATQLPAGTYNLTVTDQNGCSASYGPVTVINPNAPDAPVITASPTQVCEGGEVSFSVPANGNASYNWYGPNGFTSTDNELNIDEINVSNVGEYCVTVTIDGCMSSPSCETISLFDNPVLSINEGAETLQICDGTSATLNAEGGISYQWEGPNNFQATGNTVTIEPFTENHAGYYQLIGVDDNGCQAIDSIYVEAIDNPVVKISANVENTTYCEFSEVVLTANGADDYEWLTPNQDTMDGGTFIIDPVTNNDIGWYFVIGTDENGCQNSDSVQVSISYPEMSVSISDSVICPGDPIHLYASDGAEYYIWDGPLGEGMSTDQNFTIENTTPGHTGWYYLTYIDSSGCQATDSLYLTVKLTPDCLVFPDLVTPNGDGMNDTWEILGLEFFENVSVEIYNRWGNLVFKTDDYDNNWGGEVNKGATIGQNGIVPIGTYFFILIINDEDNTPPFKGYIEVQY